jgi:hypothetical protein
VDYRADLLNLRRTLRLKLPNITEGGADQAAASERQKKKNTPNNMVRLLQHFCLNTSTRTG